METCSQTTRYVALGLSAGLGARVAQVREVRLDWREATGPCKARSLAQALWEGEPYVLQIDSHMRFSTDWDAQLIAWLHQAERDSGIGRAVLSTYPPAYQASLQPASNLAVSTGTTLTCER